MSTGLSRAAPLLAALADGTRLAIVDRLSRGGPQSTTGLAEGTAVTRQAVAKHLQTLEAVGITRSRRSGRERVWELRPEGLEEVHRCLERIAAQWDAAVGRLRALVEEE